VALAADSPRITARALVSPAGFFRLSADQGLAWASAVWLVRPTTDHTWEPPETEVEWMTPWPPAAARPWPLRPCPPNCWPAAPSGRAWSGRGTRPVPATLPTGTGSAPNHEPRRSGLSRRRIPAPAERCRQMHGSSSGFGDAGFRTTEPSRGARSGEGLCQLRAGGVDRGGGRHRQVGLPLGAMPLRHKGAGIIRIMVTIAR